jgi:hypothetical protein
MKLEIDLGEQDRQTQKDILQELVETMPDKDIADVIRHNGTQELADELKPWVNDDGEAEEIAGEETEEEEEKEIDNG